MFNNHHLVDAEAREKIRQHEQEAEAFRRLQQLGVRDHGTAQWLFVFSALILALLVLL